MKITVIDEQTHTRIIPPDGLLLFKMDTQLGMDGNWTLGGQKRKDYHIKAGAILIYSYHPKVEHIICRYNLGNRFSISVLR